MRINFGENRMTNDPIRHCSFVAGTIFQLRLARVAEDVESDCIVPGGSSFFVDPSTGLFCLCAAGYRAGLGRRAELFVGKHFRPRPAEICYKRPHAPGQRSGDLTHSSGWSILKPHLIGDGGNAQPYGGN